MATIDDLVFTLNDEGTAYSVSAASTDISGDLVIPAEYNGLPVRIATASSTSGSFTYCRNLTSVTISEGITSIGRHAFSSCSGLTSVSLPETLISIGDSAFEGCTGLSSIEIPASVTSISVFAFFGCTNLNCFLFEGNQPSGDLLNVLGGTTSLIAVIAYDDTKDWGETWSGKPVVLVERAETDPDALIVISPNIITLRGTNDKQSVTVSSKAYSIVGELYAEGNSDWLSVSFFSGSLTVYASANPEAVRAGTITVKGKFAGSATLIVLQAENAGTEIAPDRTTLTFPASGGSSQLVDIRAGADARTLYDVVGADWISATLDGTQLRPTSVLTLVAVQTTHNGARLAVSVLPNTGGRRSGIIEVKGTGGGTVSIGVTQEAAAGQIALDSSEITVDSGGWSHAVRVMVGEGAPVGDLSVESDSDWIAATLDGETLTVSVAENLMYVARAGTVKVSAGDGSSATLSVSQLGKRSSISLTSSESAEEFSPEGGTVFRELTISGTGVPVGELSVESDADWISATLDGETLTVSVAANTGAWRSGKAVVSCSNGEAVFLAIQRGANDEVSDFIFTPGRNLTSGAFAYSVSAASTDISGDIVIPAEHCGLPVVGVNEGGFWNCRQITSVTMQAPMAGIGTFGFDSCSLKTIALPDTLAAIGMAAFGWSQLAEIVIPASVTSIADSGDGAFKYCSDLTMLAVEGGNPVYFSKGNCVVKRAEKAIIAGCKTSVIPEDASVRRIAACAFEGIKGLLGIKIPRQISVCDCSAFLDCGALSVLLFEGDQPDPVCNDLKGTALDFVLAYDDAWGWGETWAGLPVKLIERKRAVIPMALKLTVPAGGGSKTIDLVIGEEGDPMPNPKAAWLSTLVDKEKKTLTIIFEENTTGADRAGTVEMVLGGNFVIEITQLAKDVSVSVKPSSFEFPATGGKRAATLSLGAEAGTLSVSRSASWITAAVSGATLTVSVSENLISEPRSGTVTISGSGGDSATLTIAQRALIEIAPMPAALTFEAPGGTKAVALTASEDPGTLTVSCSEDWLSASAAPFGTVRTLRRWDGFAVGDFSNIGAGQVVPAADGSIAFTGRSSADTRALFDASGLEIDFSANVYRWAIELSGWTNGYGPLICWGVDDGAGGAQQKYGFGANKLSAVRWAATQNGANMTVLGEPAATTIPAANQTGTLTITIGTRDGRGSIHVVFADAESGTEYTLMNDVEMTFGEGERIRAFSLGGWISSASYPSAATVSAISIVQVPEAGADEDTLYSQLIVSAAENASESARSGAILISGALGGLVRIPVTQAGIKSMSVSPASLSFGAAGGAKALTVSDADGLTWTAESSVSWATVIPESGTGNGTLTVRVDAWDGQ